MDPGLRNYALDQGSQTRGPHVARLMWLCGPHHHKKLSNMAEITVLGADKAHSILYCSVSQPFLIGGTLPFFFNNLAAPLTVFY